MTTYHIVPRNRKYWIEAVSEKGVRKVVEGFLSEDAALRRLKILQARAEVAGQWDQYVPQKRST